MVIVLVHNADTNQLTTHIENGAPEQALAALQAAINMITQQLSGPKVFLPNGQAKVIPPPAQGPAQ